MLNCLEFFLRWLMGMMYWINTVQTYDQDGWSYLEKLKCFTDGSGIDAEFLEQVSRIVTRGCHDQSSCGYAVSTDERHSKFKKILHYFGVGSVDESNRDVPSKGHTFLPTVKPTNPPTFLPTAKPTNLPTFLPLPTAKPADLPTVLMNPKLAPPTTKPTKMPKMPKRQNPPSTHPSLRATEDITTHSPSSPLHMLPSKEKPSPFSKNDYKLTSGELANRLSYANNYCASSEEEVNAKCATQLLRTCNSGDPPCAVGNGCYENVMCKITWSDIEFESGKNEVETEIASENLSESSSLLRALVSCNGRCLRTLSASECVAGFLPDCLSVAVGEMCEHQGECGVGANVQTTKCPGGREIFIRVFVEQCSTSTTDPTIAPVEYQTLSPSSHASFSLKPSSLDGYHLNITHVNVSDGKDEEFTEPRTRKEVDFPGAWWTRRDANDSIKMFQEPKLLLLCCTVALFFISQ